MNAPAAPAAPDAPAAHADPGAPGAPAGPAPSSRAVHQARSTERRDAPALLLAPDKFKGSLSALDVCSALAEGIAETAPQATVTMCPIADGGDGTVDAAIAAGYEAHESIVAGPTGERIPARWALRGQDGVLELAETSGLRRLPGGRLDHGRAHTAGLGEAILAARDAGARRLLIGLGGSASTDGGAGLLAALGARLLDADGSPIARGHDGLAQLSSVDLRPALEALDGVELIAACDVTSPLLGPAGAASVFGPQKGLSEGRAPAADLVLRTYADLVEASSGPHRDRPGAGAAGGTGFALYALGARFVSGADAVLDLLGFDAQLEQADVVLIGEGRLDEQTLQGKGPAEVARRARARGRRVLAAAGAVSLTGVQLEEAGIERVWDLLSRAEDVEDAMARGRDLLVEIGREVGREIGRDHVRGDAMPALP